MLSVPAGLVEIVGLERDIADVTALAIALCVDCGLVDAHLKAVEREEALVVELGVRNEYLVVCICNDGVTKLLVSLFYLLGSLSTVRKVRMAVKICFVKVPVFGQKIFFHNVISLKNYSKYIITQFDIFRNRISNFLM